MKSDELFDIKARVIVIPGGTGKLGRIMSEALIEKGAKVILLGRDREKGKTAVSGIKGARFYGCDITKEKEVKLVSEKILRDFGRVDFRLNATGKPNVIEVNPIPGINPKIEEVSYFTKICRLAGMNYHGMIERVLDETMERIQFR